MLTPEDGLAAAKSPPVGVERPPAYHALATGSARFAGEPVAVVVARTLYEAEDALEHIEVVYEWLTPITDPKLSFVATPRFCTMRWARILAANSV